MPQPRTHKNHDSDRERWALELLLRELPEWDQYLIGAARIATYLNSHSFRTWHANTLVSASHIARWAAAGEIPVMRGVGGHSGRPIVASLAVLTAWLHGPQRRVKLDRRVCAMERQRDGPGLQVSSSSGRGDMYEEKA